LSIFSFHTHTFGKKIWRASAVQRRGISKDSAEAAELAAHEYAVRARVLEIRLFVRPNLDTFTVNAPQDPLNCKMGIYSALIKELSKEKSTINCVSPFFLPLLIESLRVNAKEFSSISQNYKPPAEFEELLLEKIKEIEEVVMPPLPLQLLGDDGDMDKITGYSILENKDEFQLHEEGRDEEDRNLFPIFRKRHNLSMESRESTPKKKREHHTYIPISPIKKRETDCTQLETSDEEEEDATSWLKHEIPGTQFDRVQKNNFDSSRL